MTTRFFISSHRNCRRFLAATHHAAILNNYTRDLQVLQFTVERKLLIFRSLEKFAYRHLEITLVQSIPLVTHRVMLAL